MIAGGLDEICSDATQARYGGARELCLFSKNCGNDRARLAYSINCQA